MFKNTPAILTLILLLFIPTLSFGTPKSAGGTDKGIMRAQNEDSYIIFQDQQVYIVADGMGGHAAGEVASALACKTAELFIQSHLWGRFDRFLPRFRTDTVLASYHAANQVIIRDAMKNPARRGMGTTMVSAVVRDNAVDIINVGDSRAYRIRDGKIQQVSHDQSLVQQYIDEGILKTPEEIEAFPYKNIITQAMGTQPEIVPDVKEYPIADGDIYLLCSDGLTNELDDETILHIVLEHLDNLDLAVKTLIDRANAAGGKDNITVVIIQIPLTYQQNYRKSHWI